MTDLLEKALAPRVTRWKIFRSWKNGRTLLAGFPAAHPHETPEEALKRYREMCPRAARGRLSAEAVR